MKNSQNFDIFYYVDNLTAAVPFADTSNHLENRASRHMRTTLIAPRPLDMLELPVELDGRNGVNRAHGRRQIAANDDLNAIRAWLARVIDTQTTFEGVVRLLARSRKMA
jgi:hypothetical protein